MIQCEDELGYGSSSVGGIQPADLDPAALSVLAAAFSADLTRILLL